MGEPSSADFHGTLGRYALFGEIAAGGMATVHLGRLIGPVGFARTVAIKRLHPHLRNDPEFVAMFLEEARLAARVRHPNVVSTLDVVDEDDELFLVMEFVPGESLSRLIRRSREAGLHVPPRHLASVMCAALEGLHAAHDATSERGKPLGIVHRDVSPQNIHVGLDGVARVLDFGIAKATNRVQETRTDQIKGKVAYMSPEQLAKGPIDRRADVYSASVVLWEALTGKRLFKADDMPALVYAIVNDPVYPPSSEVPDLPPGLDDVVMRGLDRDPGRRWSSAREMAVALEKVLAPTPTRELGEWVRETAGELLAWRMDLVHRIESETSSSIPPPGQDDSLVTKNSGIVKSPHARRRARQLDTEDERATLPRLPPPSSTTDVTPPRSRRPLVLGAAALLLVAGGALAFRLAQLRAPVSSSAAATSASASASTSAEHEPAIVLEASRSSAPAASSPAKPAATAAPPKPTWNDCDNPFTIDAKGARHPKPHCFRR